MTFVEDSHSKFSKMITGVIISMEKMKEVCHFKSDSFPTLPQTHTPLHLSPSVWLLRQLYLLIIDTFYRKLSGLTKQVHLIIYLIHLNLTILCS